MILPKYTTKYASTREFTPKILPTKYKTKNYKCPFWLNPSVTKYHLCHLIALILFLKVVNLSPHKIITFTMFENSFRFSTLNCSLDISCWCITRFVNIIPSFPKYFYSHLQFRSHIFLWIMIHSYRFKLILKWQSRILLSFQELFIVLFLRRGKCMLWHSFR